MPANTPSGLPYPLPTEPVRDGAVAIRALAEATDTLLIGPWQSCTNNSGYSGTVKARREGGTTVLAGSLTGPWTGTPGPCTIPVGLRPVFPAGAGMTYFAFSVPHTASGGGPNFANVRVWADGAITLTQSSIPSGGGGAFDSIRFPSKGTA
jgi:hypothetical protein